MSRDNCLCGCGTIRTLPSPPEWVSDYERARDAIATGYAVEAVRTEQRYMDNRGKSLTAVQIAEKFKRSFEYMCANVDETSGFNLNPEVTP